MKYIAIGLGWNGMLNEYAKDSLEEASVSFANDHHKDPYIILTLEEYKRARQRVGKGFILARKKGMM